MLVAVFRTDDSHHFDLIKLVLTDHAAGVAPVGTGFTSKARRVRRHKNRQVRGLQHLPGHRVRQRHFSGRNEVQRIALTLLTALFGGKEVFFKLRQLPGAAHRVGRDDIGRVALGVAVLAGVDVQHELRNGAVQMRDLPLHETETCAGKFRGRIKVHPEGSAHIDVVLDREVKRAGRSPAALLHIVAFIAPRRNGFVRQIGDTHEELI